MDTLRRLRIPTTETAMETSRKSGMHPLIVIAAVSVTLFSLAGLGAITGLIPTSHSQSAPAQAAMEAPAPATLVAATEPAANSVPATAASETKAALHKTATRQVKPVVHAKRSTVEPVQVAAADTPVPIAQNNPPAYPPANMMPPPPPNAVPPRPICRDCGVIESVREVEKKGQASGSGAAIGGIAGGVLGNQAGRGNGRTAMTLLGVVGGAIAGHEIEKNTAKAKSYEIDIRFDDGTTRLITQDTPPVWRSGDRVRVRDGVITASNAY
jgi:outer membrane lipoprotein SlyB